SPSSTASATTGGSSTTIDNGYTGVFDGNTQPNSFAPIGSLFTGLSAGTIDTMTIDVGANCGSDNLEGALYDTNGNLLADSNSISCTGGEMDVTLNNAVTVPANGKLWAMVMSSGGNAQFNAKATGVNTSYLGTSQGSLSFPSTIILVADYTYSPHIILYLHSNLHVPQPPTGLTATTISTSQINLSSTAPANN